MTNDLMQKIDKGYSLLLELTNSLKAKNLFECYLLSKPIKDEIDDLKVRIAFKELTKYDLFSQIAKHALIYSCIGKDVPLQENCVAFKNHLIENNIEYDKVVDYLDDNKEELKSIIKGFIEQRYSDEHQHRKIDSVNDPEVQKYIAYLNPADKVEHKASLLGRIKSFAFNRCKKDIISDKQVKINHRKYALGKELYATIDRGNDTLSQEDGVLIGKHPDFKDVKIIAVADGESDLNYGERASNYALISLITWFDRLDESVVNSPERLKISLESFLNHLNFDLHNTILDCATTIAVAVVGKEKTVIATIGDTRIYKIKDNKIAFETRDDSYVQKLCDEGIATRENARFYKAGNILTESVGKIKDKKVVNRNTMIIDNDYDKLLILSDGVTKLVSNDRIEDIIVNTSDEEITEKLVNVAKTEDSHMEEINAWCNRINKAGQKNATAAMYVKRRV